jgi:hypothetical protein
VGFTDILPAGLVVSTPNGESGACGGGIITANAGSGSVVLSGATVAPGGACTFSVSVTGTAAGSQVNTTSVPVSTEGGSGTTATATVVVVAPPVIAKSFGAANVSLNGTTSVTFTVTNPAANTVAEMGVGFTDTLPSGLVVATPNGESGSCGGGTITATAGSGTISLAGATIAAGASCTFSVNVIGTTSGVKNNSVTVSSTNGGTGNTSNASLTVALAPAIAKSFGAATIPLNGSTTLSFTITNPNTGFALTGIGFSDSLPSGLVVSTPNGESGSCGGGSITAAAGSGTVGLSGATLAGDASCTFSVNDTATTAGVKNNSVTVSSTNGGTGNTATASITVVAPPTLSKSFGAPSIPFGRSTSLTFTVTNPNTGTSLSGVGFTDTMPSGLLITRPNSESGTCGGGTITASAGSRTIRLTGATLAAGGTCTFSVNVTGIGGGRQVNITSVPVSNEGGSGTAATATVVVAPPPALWWLTWWLWWWLW